MEPKEKKGMTSYLGIIYKLIFTSIMLGREQGVITDIKRYLINSSNSIREYKDM